MSAHITKLTNYLKEHANELAEEIVNKIIPYLKTQVPSSEITQAKFMYSELFSFLGASLTADSESENPGHLLKWSRDNGEREATEGRELSEIIDRYPPSRRVIIEYFTKLCGDFQLSQQEVCKVYSRINYILDISISETVMSFEKKASQLLKDAQKEAHELAAQIVPIQDGIAILPLYGTIDHDRASYIIEIVLPRLSESPIDWLIIDFSGIVNMDSEAADHLFAIHNMLKLVGIQVIITGMRPKLAQQAILQGIDFSGIQTFGNVMQAIRKIS